MKGSQKLNNSDLKILIDEAWENAADISPDTGGKYRDAVNTALNLLDTGQVRVAEKTKAGWKVNQWLKKAVLLSFRYRSWL